MRVLLDLLLSLGMIAVAFASMVFLVYILFVLPFKKKTAGVKYTIPVTPPSPYRKRYRLMTNSETSFFYALRKEIPQHFHILSKVRIADILETKDGHDYYKHRNKILPKHIDFVVCNETFEPLLAIELDGSSHNRPAQREIDKLKDEIFAGVGLPLVRPRVGTNFSEYCRQLRSYF